MNRALLRLVFELRFSLQAFLRRLEAGLANLIKGIEAHGDVIAEAIECASDAADSRISDIADELPLRLIDALIPYSLRTPRKCSLAYWLPRSL